MHVSTYGQSVRAYVCTIVQACVRIFVQCIYPCVRTLGQADGSSREDFAAASEQLPLGDGWVGLAQLQLQVLAH